MNHALSAEVERRVQLIFNDVRFENFVDLNARGIGEGGSMAPHDHHERTIGATSCVQSSCVVT